MRGSLAVVGEYNHKSILMIRQGNLSDSSPKLLRKQTRAKRNRTKSLVQSYHSDIRREIESAAYRTFRRGTPLDSRNNDLIQFLYSRLRKTIAAAINELPERERLVMTLFYYEELSLAQVGTVIGESYTRVSQIHASGLVNLRSRLGDPFSTWEPTIHTSARPPTNGSKSAKKMVRPPEHEGQ
jgi:RNA polymerase sigma factor (sigma-70 family)